MALATLGGALLSKAQNQRIREARRRAQNTRVLRDHREAITRMADRIRHAHTFGDVPGACDEAGLDSDPELYPTNQTQGSKK